MEAALGRQSATPVGLVRVGVTVTASRFVYDVGSDSDVWTFVTPQGSKEFRVSGGFLANDVRAVHLAVRTGYGIAYLALVEVFDDFRSDTLVRVLGEFPSPGVPYSLVYPSRRHLAPRTRLAMDFIWEQVQQIQAELATASDEGALRKHRANAFIPPREALIRTSRQRPLAPRVCSLVISGDVCG